MDFARAIFAGLQRRPVYQGSVNLTAAEYRRRKAARKAAKASRRANR